MIKAIKKLFSVDESELDFDEFEEAEDKSNLYKEELEKLNQTTKTNNVNTVSSFDSEMTNNRYTEVQDNLTYNQEPIGEPSPNIEHGNEVQYSVPVEKIDDDIVSDISQVLDKEVVQSSYEQPSKKSFDFEKAIDNDIYQKAETVKIVKEEQTEKVEALKQIDENKEDYVLKDIISPMRGVIRKETNTIKKEEGHKRAQIIKLREQVKAKEIDDTQEIYAETMELPIRESDTKDLADTLSSLEKSAPRDTLSETSKFTLIEDSTGEMRLVIDEDE